MKKQYLAVTLAAAMTLSLAACGGSGSSESTTAAGLSAAATTAAADSTGITAGGDETTAAAAESEEINYYGFDEPTTVKIGISYAAAPDFTFYGGETVDDNAWLDLYKANNIITDVLYEVDPSQEATKLSTAIMSGDYPDVFSSNASEYRNYVESEVVADITEAYEKYATDELKAYMEFDGGMALNSLMVDGKLYGLPRINNDPYASAHVMWIRKDWLDNLGLEIPTTMEELKEVARAFTQDDPDGNGQNDTYGLALDGINIINDSVGNTDPIFNAYGAYLGKNGLTYVEGSDGSIVWGGANAEGMKSALQLLRDMYEEGSIARDFITMDYNTVMEEETGAGRCGIWFGPNWGAMNPAVGATQNDPNCEIIAAHVPSGTGERTKAYASSSAGTVYYVSSKCEHPEMLIKLFNLSVKYQNADNCTADEYNMYYGDSANYSGWKTSIIAGGGPDGNATNAALVAAVESGDDSQLNAKQMENYTAIKTYMDAVADGSFDPADASHQRGLALYTVHIGDHSAWSVTRDMMANNDYVLAAYNGVPSEEVSNNSGTLQKLLVETIVKIITGAQDVDSYDTFLDTWYAMGGEDAIAEANELR